MKKEKNPLKEFLVGMIMLVAGLYWFMSSVMVTTGFYSFRIGGLRTGGLVIVPFIAGIIWFFANTDSIGAKFLMGGGLLIIIASIIMGTHFVFLRTNLYEYLLMVVLIFGGATLVLKVLLAKPKGKDIEKK